MEITLTLNLWFVVSLCLLSALLGVMIGCRIGVSRLSRSDDYRRY